MSKGSFLSGPEPEETEEKTTAELEDAKRPSTMDVSSSMFDLAETDDRPAIEQKAAKGVIFTQANNQTETNSAKSTSARNFKIDADFAAEMHERERKEKAERIEKQKAAEAAEKKERAERKQAIAAKLEQSQTLDEEQLREEIKDEIAADNQDKLYPDGQSLEAQVEDELWRKRTEAGKQIAGRAKIDSVFDTDLDRIIKLCIVIDISAAIFAVASIISQTKNLAITPIFYLGTAILALGSLILLVKQGNQCKRHIVPSNQRTQFKLAAFIPGLLIRVVLIMVFLNIPMTGGLIGVITGAAIGASIHYSILNRYGIFVSIKDTLVNTTVFLAFYLLLMVGTIINSCSVPVVSSGFEFIGFIISAIEFVLGDRAAMLLALYTNK